MAVYLIANIDVQRQLHSLATYGAARSHRWTTIGFSGFNCPLGLSRGYRSMDDGNSA